MKFFSTGLLLLIVFGSLEGSTIPHKRTVRALNATIQTHFNGTIQRRNPCNDKEVERSSYKGCHEFHHHSKESNWSDYTRKCATLISDFFHAISNLVTFKDRQSGTFDLNINTKVSHKTDGDCVDAKKPICPTPTVIVESTDCEVPPSTSCNDLPRKHTHIKDSEICSLEEAVKFDEQDEKCPVGSETSVDEDHQTADSSSFLENDKCLDVSDETVSNPEPIQEVNPPETKPQSGELPPETIPTYDNYSGSDQTSETTNVESSVSNTYDDKSVSIAVKPGLVLPSSEAPSAVATSTPKEDLYIDVSETPQQSTGTDNAGQETPSDSKDYLSDYKSQTEKIEIQPSLPVTQPEKVVPEDDGQSIEFSDKIALFNVHEPRPESFQTISPPTQHYFSDTTTPPTFKIQSDYDYVQDMPVTTQPTYPPQYQSESYDEQVQSGQAVTFTPLQPQPENYVNQYDQGASDLPASFRQPQAESPSSSSLTNEPTSIQPPALPESHSENHVNYEDESVSNQVPISVSPPTREEPSVEYSDQLAVYNVRQPSVEPTSTQPTSSQPGNYDSYEDESESNESMVSSSPTVNVEPSVEFSDQLAVYNIRTPTTTYPPSSVSHVETSSTQPSVPSETQTANYVNYEDETVEKQAPTFPPSGTEEAEPSIEFSDQLAVYNVREPLPATTTPYPLATSSIQSSASQSDNYMNYENDFVPNQVPTTSSPQQEDNQYLEYSDQLAVYNVREPLPGTTTFPPLVSTSVQPSSSESDSDESYEEEEEVVAQQTSTAPSPQQGEDQYLEYSDQLAVYNVREPLPSTTTASSPAVIENIQSNLGTTLSPSFSSYELNTFDNQKTEIEPQPTFAPKFEEEIYSSQPVTSQPQPVTEYYGEYNEQTSSNQMSAFTTPAGNVYPTSIPSSEYIDNNGPESPLPDYPSSQDIGGFVSTTLPSSSYDTNSFNNYELQYDSQPASTLLPSEPDQDQVFSDQVSDIREPQSDSSVSDGRISDSVTQIPPISESESSISYDDESSLTDSRQIVQSESQPEKSITNEYPEYPSSIQPLPNDYDTYDEQSSTSDVEAPTTSANEPTTYQQFPIEVITTEPENFAIYDDPKFSAESQGTYPPKIENESFANYDDNNGTSTAGQASVSIEPLSDNDSSETEPDSSEEGSSSEEDNEDVAVSDDQGLLPLSPNTFRPTVQIETTVNYADQTPFRPIRLPSSIGPLQENNIIYDEGILRNETEPSALGGEEDADNSLIVSSERTKQNEGKDYHSSTTLAPDLEFDTYYEETFKQSSSSDAPKLNNYMIYEDDVQPSSPKSDLNTTISNDYSASVFPSTPSYSQEIVTAPSTPESMPDTYTDYGYSKNDLNSQTTFPPQTESALYDDHSTQDQSLTEQQSVDYPAYDNQIQSTSSPVPKDQEMIDFSDELSIYNVPETVLESSPPSLSELLSSSMITTAQPSVPSDRKRLELELQPTSSPSVEPQSYDEPLPPNEIEPSLEYSDQLSVYNVRQPQTETPSPSSLTNEPTSIQPPALPESHSENYVNYEDESVSNRVPISVSPPTGEEPSVEYSDQLAVYNVRQPSVEPTSTQPTSSQPDSYDSYEDDTELNESTTSSSPTVNVEPSLEYSDEAVIYNVQLPHTRFSSPSPPLDENIPKMLISTLPPYDSSESESEEDHEDETGSDYSPTTFSSPTQGPFIELTDELAIYNARQPSTVSPLSSVSYLQPSSVQPPIAPQSQPDNYVYYADETPSTQMPTTSSPRQEDNQYLEYSDQLAVYNVREPLPGTTTFPPLVSTSVQPSSSESDSDESYEEEEEVVAQQTSTSPSPQHGEEQYIEYSDQLAVYNVREPLLSTTTSSPADIENVPSSVGTTPPPLFSSDRIETYDDPAVGNEFRATVPPEVYDEPTSAPPTDTQSENYANYEDGELPISSPPPKSIEPFLEYSDQLSIYNVRQPEYHSSSPSPVSENLVTATVPNLPPDDFGTYDNRVEYTDSQGTFPSESDPQMYDEPTTVPSSSVSQSDVYTNYDDTVRRPFFETTPSSPSEIENVSSGAISVSTIVPFPSRDSFESYNSSATSGDYVSTSSQMIPESQVNYEDYKVLKEDLPSTPSTFDLAQSQQFSVPPFNHIAEQEFDYQPTSPPQSQGDYTNYEDQTVSNALTTTSSPVREVEPSLEYSDQLAIYNVREPVFESTTTAPVVSSITTTSPSLLIDELTSPQPSPVESQSDSDDDYEDETVPNETQTTLSTPVQVPPSVEYSDELAAFNVPGPVILPISDPAVKESIPSGDVTTSLPSSLLNNESTSVQSSSESQSESDEDYEDETTSTPSPAIGDEPSLEASDEISIYQPQGFESQPTFSPEGESQVYSEPTAVPNTFSQSQDNYANEIVSNEPMTTFRPSVNIQPSLEYSDEFDIYNVQSPSHPSSSPSPLLNENVAVDTVSTFMPSPVYDEPTSAPSTSPEEQPDSYMNYEDQLPSNETPIAYSPPKEEPSLTSSDQHSISTTSSQSDAYDYDSHFEYTDSQTIVPTPQLTPQISNEPTSIRPLTSSEPQPEQYVNYEDESVSTPLSTSTSPTSQVEPTLEYSDEFAVYTVRESLPGTTTLPPVVNEIVSSSVVTTLPPSSPLMVEPISVQPSSSESESDSDEEYEDETVSSQPSTTLSTPVQVEPTVEYSDEVAVYNVREPIFTSTLPPVISENTANNVFTTLPPSSPLLVETVSVQPSSSESESDSDEDYEDETVSSQPSTTQSPSVQVEPSLEYSDEVSIYNVRQPEYSSSTPSSLSENFSNEMITTAAPSRPFYDNQVLYNDFQPTSSPQSDSQMFEESNFVPASSEWQPDIYVNYEDKTVPSQASSSVSPPVQIQPSVEYSDEVSVYNVREPISTSTPPPVISENTAYSGVTILPPQISNEPTSIQPLTSSEPQPEQYVNYEDESVSTPLSTSTSPTSQVEPTLEYSDEFAVYTVRESLPGSTTLPPVVNEIVSSTVVTTLPPSSPLMVEPISVQPSSSESESDSDEDYEDETVSSESPTTLPTPVQVEPSVEVFDEVAVYDVREPLPETTTLPPVVSDYSVLTTLPPPSSLIVDQTSETQSESEEDYEDETVSTPSPVIAYEPSLELSDEVSIYNVRQRPSEMTTPSPFNNNVLSNLMTTISPYFTFEESSSKDDLNTISQTTVSPESDMYDEESSIQPSQSNEDDSQAISDETTSKDLQPETLSNFDEQTIPNVIQSTQSPDLSNQPYNESEVEYQKASFITVQPDVGSSVISDSSVETSTEQELDYQPTSSPDYETHETMTAAPSYSQSQDNYVVYEDQTVPNESPTPSPVYEVEPSLEYSNQLAVNNALVPETSASYSTSTPSFLQDTYTMTPSSVVTTDTYTDYEGSTVNFSTPPTLYEEPTNPGQVQTSTSPQPQIVNYDYYNDQIQKSEESSASTPTTEIDTTITLTEIGPTFPPNFESQVFDKSDSVQQASSETQPDNYVDYEDSVVSTQIPATTSPQITIQPSIESSDELTVYTVRKPYFEPTSTQPPSSFEPQPDNYDTYEDQVIVNELPTPSTSQTIEYTVVQPTSAPEEEAQVYDEPTSSPATSPEPQQDYVNDVNEMVSYQPMTSTVSTNQLQPSLEYSDELSVYNVREQLPETTTPSSVTSENITTSVVTSLSPSSDSQSESDEDYEDETVSNEPPTTLPTPVQVEPSIEYSDEVSVYNVREPIFTSTLPPVISENTATNVFTTLPPSSPLMVETVSVQPSSSESESDSDEDYEEETVSSQPSTILSPSVQVEPSLEYSDEVSIYNVRQPEYSSSTPSSLSENFSNEMITAAAPSQPFYDNQVLYNDFQPTSSPQSDSQMFEESNFVPASSEWQPDNYVNYEDKTVPSQASSSVSPPVQLQSSVEYSDEVSAYNVREPISTSTLPPVISENTATNVFTSLPPSSPLLVETVSVQPSSSESESDSDEEYEDETVSSQPSTTLSTPVQVEPTVEYSDEVAVYNVRAPISTSTLSPVISENIEYDMVTTLPPSSTSFSEEPTSVQPLSTESQLESDEDYDDETVSTPTPLSVQSIPAQPSSNLQSGSYTYEEYKDETVSKEPLTTLSTPVQVEPSVEVFDEVAVYDVREPLPETTTLPPVVSDDSVLTTLPPSSSLIVDQTSESQSESEEDYEDETVSTPSPVTAYEPSLELSDEVSIYNVRQRPSEMTTPSPFNNNVINDLMNTISPYFTSSPNENEDYTFQSSVTSEPEPEIYDRPYSTSLPSSESTSNNNVNSEISWDEYSTSSPPTEPQESWSSASPFKYQDQVSVYNVRQRSPLIENSSDNVVTTYDIQNDQGDSKSYEDPSTIQKSSSVGQPENYVSYEDVIVSNDLPTSLPPATDEQPSIEFSDELAIYNARQPSTVSPLSSVSYLQPSSVQPPIAPQSQPDNYVYYADETPSTQIPTTSSPRQEDNQYLEYSDQLAVYNVREPLPGTTTFPPLVSTSVQPSSSESDSDESYEEEEEVVAQQTSTSPSPQHGEEQYIEYSDQLAVYNVREPLPSTTTSSPADIENVPSSVTTTSIPFFESDQSLTQNNVPVQTESTFAPQYEQETNATQTPFDSQSGSYEDYEGEFLTTVPPSQDIKTPSSNIVVPTTAPDAYDYDSHFEYTDSQTIVPTPQVTPQISNEPTSIQPLTSSEPQPEQYVNYEDESVSTPLSTSTSPTSQVEPTSEYSDEFAVYTVRESLPGTTTLPPVVNEIVSSRVVTTLPPPSPLMVEPISVQPSSSESESDSDEEYEDETVSSQSSTTLSTPVQVEPSVEYSDEVAVYNVRAPISTSTLPPVINENIEYDVVTTLPPSSSNFQSDSYIYDDYKDETVSHEPLTTLSTPKQVEPSLEYSDQVAVYNVRQPEFLSSLSPLTENSANDLVTTVTPSIGGSERYDNKIVYTDFQPTSSPQSESQVYDEPTSIPSSSSESQSDNYVNYEGEMASNVAVTSSPPPIDVDVEYSDELDIYNVGQSSTAAPLLSDIVTTPPSSIPDSDRSYTFTDQLSIVREPESDSHVKAFNMFTTLPPFTQSSVGSEQNDFYTYDDQTQSPDSRTTFSPETEIEYDEEPTTLEPQFPSSTQSLQETMVTTIQPLTESQINKTSTPSKQQEVSTFPPLHSFIPLNQPSYPLPEEVSVQQGQVISDQVINSPLVPSSPLDSDKQSNNFSNLVQSQETRSSDGVENIQRDTPQPEPLVPDQTNPSNEPGEDYVSCTCTRGNGRATQHTLMCPFNPVLKGNMTAPSYYILITKLYGDSGNKSLPDEDHFQVEKVYLGDGTPLNCTEERKPFPTSKYTPVPISSARTVKIPIRLNNA